MSGQLTSYISSILNPLQNIQRQLTQQAASYRDAQHVLLNQEQSLIGIGNGLDAFVGLGANSFKAACEQYIAQSERNAQLIDQALQVIGGCIEEIWQSTTSAEIAFLDEVVVSAVLAKITLESLLRDGADAVMGVLNEIVHFCASTGDFFGRSLEHLLSSAVHAVVSIAQDIAHITNEVWNLLGQIPRVLSQWASVISNAVSRCLNAIKNYYVSHFTYIPHVVQDTSAPNLKVQQAYEDFLNKPTSGNLEKLDETIEGTKTQMALINLNPGKNPPTYILVLAGLDFKHWGDVNNAPDALESGLGFANNPYTEDVKSLLSTLPSGSKVYIWGHSLGGMTGEWVYQGSQDGKTNYSIPKVFTLGSPSLIPSSPGLVQYSNPNDYVPLLSWHLLPFFATATLVTGGDPITGLLLTGLTVVALNEMGGPVKQLFGETVILKDEGNSLNPKDVLPNHTYTKSPFLNNQPIRLDTNPMGPPIDLKAGQIGDIKYFSGTPQDTSDPFKALITIGN